jgi:GT2 family glycosyltransferase
LSSKPIAIRTFSLVAVHPDKALNNSNRSSAAAPRPKKKKGPLSRGWKVIRDSLFPRRKKVVSYAVWIKKFDTLGRRDRRAIKEHIARLSYHPRISVVMAGGQANERWLAEAIESLHAQLYDNWELCVAGAASSSNGAAKTLKKLAADPRIKWAPLSQNGDSAVAANSALELASGEFVALMDQDDSLAEHALYEAIAELNDHPHTDIIYSDEDCIDDKGLRSNPHFKTDWNPELFLSQNMLDHLAIFRKTLIDKIGGFRTGFEGAQNYDLALRASRETSSARIRHIPAILYHRRHVASGGSPSQANLQKTIEAARRARTQHLLAIGDGSTLEPHPLTKLYDRVRRSVPEPAPLVSLIVPTRNAAYLMRPCLDGILHRTDYKNFEIIIIDHESDEPETIELLREASLDPRVRIMPYQGEFNYSDMNNKAVALARGELIGLINNDIEVIGSDWLTEMVSLALRPENGAIGAKLLYPDGTVQHAGVVVGLGGGSGHIFVKAARDEPGYFGRLQLTSNISAVTAACLLVKKSIFQEVGGLNAVELKVAFNDVDLSLKIAARGYRNVWTPYALLTHHESPSRGFDHDDPVKFERNQREVSYMRAKWSEIWECEPFFNVNLSLRSPDFELAAPPRRVRPWNKPDTADSSAAPRQKNLGATRPLRSQQKWFAIGCRTC